MAKVLKDLSQLPRSSFKPSDPVKKPPPPKSPDDDARAVLAYFSKKGQTAEVPAEAQTDDGEAAKLKALEETIRKLTDAKEKAETRALIAEQNLAKTAVARTKAEDEVKRLQGECGRLQGEARKRAEAETRPEETAPATPIEAPPANGLLILPKSFAEVFDGELREMVLAALADARDAAKQSGKTRRTAALDAVLAVNRSSGELDRRRTELQQILKNYDHTSDPAVLSKLGFKLIRKRTHWILDYAGVRLTLSKTPSDFRANRNKASVIENKCF
jgi:hypothetical protein